MKVYNSRRVDKETRRQVDKEESMLLAGDSMGRKIQ